MNDEEMTREIAKSAHAFSVPIDFEKLINDGLLVKRGKSYYLTDTKSLPEIVSKRIKTVTPTPNGVRVTFYKESKSLKKIADSLSHYLE